MRNTSTLAIEHGIVFCVDDAIVVYENVTLGRFAPSTAPDNRYNNYNTMTKNPLQLRFFV